VSYTGEDVVEVTAHGSPVVLGRILEEATRAGARLAKAGEFTLRAHLHGRLDLVQAEAVADLIEATTIEQAGAAFDQLTGALTERIRVCEQTVFDLITRLEASLDFPEEGYHFVSPGELGGAVSAARETVDRLLAGARRGRILREGARVVIAGRPNAGKSTLFNALLGTGRAIVTKVAGTTRDLISERVEIEGVPVTLVDTAGVRPPADEVEEEGVRRAQRAAETADLLLVLLDRSEPLEADDRQRIAGGEASPRIVVATKTDLPARWYPIELALDGEPVLGVSSHRDEGLVELRAAIASRLGTRRSPGDPPLVCNLRQIRLLESARTALDRAFEAASHGASEEFVLEDLRDASAAFGEVTGRHTPDDVLEAIFARFCIGK
jgi:tRNA modification GTPase